MTIKEDTPTPPPLVANIQSKLTQIDPAEEALKEALKIVTGARRKAYGKPENNFAVIAAFWNTYLNQRYHQTLNLMRNNQPTPRPLMKRGTTRLDGIDVAIMMDLMKTARLIESPNHKDSWVDKCGYSACGHRCASVDLPNTETDGSGTGD